MKICTHDGRFHCDEVMACAMLVHYSNKFKGAKIQRSRDPKIWDQSDILVDVGGKYQFPKYLDHHQIEFQNTYSEHYQIRMSSAGLVYLHFKEIIPNIITQIIATEKEKLTFDPITNEEIITQIREKTYKNLILYVDANDNGVDKVFEKDVASVPATLWATVAKMNPMWWEEEANQYESFIKAVKIVKDYLYSDVRQMFLGSIQTKQIVKKAFEDRNSVHQSGKIVLLTKYVPWQKNISELQLDFKCEGEILYVVFPEKGGKKWRIQAIAAREGSFELRKGLRSDWRGVKDQQKLINLSGIEDIDFVHASGFIGGAVSRESAIRMGELSMKE